MPKLLADFLQEQQEPFALEVYLIERGYPKHNSGGKHVAPDCSYFVRAVFSQFIVANGNRGRRNFKPKRRPENAAEDGFSAASTSCSECDARGSSHCSESAIRRFVKSGNCFLEGAADDAQTNSKLRAEKQLSPVSVFGETDSDQDSPIHYKQCNFKIRVEQPSSSTSRSRLKQPRRNVCRELREVDHYDQYIINKMALQQREQLLIDCKQELIEIDWKREKNGNEIKATLGAEEMRRHACEKVWIWSHDSNTESNLLHLLHSDFLASVDEWNAIFEQNKFEICMEIENAVLENVVDEIIPLVRFSGTKNVYL